MERSQAAFGVPTLSDLYRSRGTDFELSIDVEHATVALPMVDVAESFGAAERLWLCAEDPLVLGLLRERTRHARLVCSTGPRRLGGLRTLVSRLAELDVDVVNLHWADWTARRLDLVRHSGLLAEPSRGTGIAAGRPGAHRRLLGGEGVVG